MRCEKELYGADADGNRGVWVWEYEIEKSDRDEIVDQIRTFIEQNEIEEDDLPSTCKVFLSCDRNGEEVEFEVEIADYL